MQKIDEEVKNLHKRIGLNVKQLREEKNFTQLELAMAIGQKSTTIISQAELGTKKHFNIEQLYKISKVLECNISDFFIRG
jgi:transcriptional regulator with XRE-family HTH domain